MISLFISDFISEESPPTTVQLGQRKVAVLWRHPHAVLLRRRPDVSFVHDIIQPLTRCFQRQRLSIAVIKAFQHRSAARAKAIRKVHLGSAQ